MTRFCGFTPWLPALALVAVLLAASPLSERFAAGQGLDSDPLHLAIDIMATAYELSYFEELLALLFNFGGRGRGIGHGPDVIYPRLSKAFLNATGFEQLQADYYYLGAAPKKYESSDKSQTPAPDGQKMGLDYVPPPFDQQLCSTCVGQAAAMAVRMSIAYTLRKPVESVSISPLAFYYCSSSGRTCRTGWDIQPALAQMEAHPQLLLPSKCFDAAFDSRKWPETKIESWAKICARATTKSKIKKCRTITKERPLYTCTYKPLSTFLQVQQHIQNHGAVITRIVIHDDFELQFNSTERYMSGLKLGPYRHNVSAKPVYGHAAVIVGYDSNEFTWTLLNSWGRGTDPSQTRLRGGVTADGMFKIQMGLAGVGTPEKSYGVACEPAAGTPDNLNGQRPWLATRRKPVLKVNVPGEQYCYNYTTLVEDTVPSIVDHFGLDVRSFVQMNEASVGKVGNYTYKFRYKLRAEELSRILDVVDKSTKKVAGGARPAPYFDCFAYSADGKESKVTCGEGQPFNTSACAEPDVVGCILHYKDINTTMEIPPNTTLTVCNDGWADTKVFERVAYEVQPLTGHH